ncbi:MAG: sugar ABC transporter substrate-binding protein [Oscillospiraceae bacterium]|nr:sugar ABC transporter substrate-binding protein [Oscillospiraceae bacterium]
MKRIFCVLLCIILLSVLISGCNSGNGNESNGNESTGEITVLLPLHPYGDLLIDHIHEFEEQTGIIVNIEQINEGEITAKQAEGIENGTFVADVFMTRPMTETLNFLQNDWMLPLGDYDISDYPENTLEIGFRNGNPYFIPLIIEWQVLYYRKDLMQAAGLLVPKNFDELEEAARLLNENGVAGFASRGAGSPAVSQLSSFIYNFGGRYIKDGIAVFDSPEAVEAISFYGKLLGMYGPDGVGEMSWSEIMSLFHEGKVAMWTDASVFYGQLIDPEHSQVAADNIGIARLPRGPVSDEPYIMPSWGMSISSKTEAPEHAKQFLEWATSAEMAKKAMLENIPMARSSVWNDSEITTHMNPEIVETMIHASQNGYPYALPIMTSIVRARELIGEVISESILTNGTSPRLQTLATENTNAVNNLLKADGEYGTAR